MGPKKMWGGRGNRDACDACGEPVLATQVEYEFMVDKDVAYRFHISCARIWQAELVRRGVAQEAPRTGGRIASQGPDLPDFYRRAASYVSRILMGAKPGDRPVQRPEKFQLVVNLKTARALKLTLPQALVRRADRVIE